MATQQSQQAAHFNAVANLQNNWPDFGLLDFTEASRREFRTFLDYLFDHDPVSKIGIHILEIGAGTGRYTIPLAQLGYRVTAQDISNSSLEQIHWKAMQLHLDERIEIKCGDATQPLFKSNTFDAVFCINLLHHVPNPVTVIRLMHNYVKPGGVLLCMEPNGHSLLMLLFITLSLNWSIEKGALRSTLTNLQNWFREAGCVNVLVGREGWLPTKIGNYLPLVFKLNSLMNHIRFVQDQCAFFVIHGVK